MSDWLNWDLFTISNWQTLTVASGFFVVLQVLAIYSVMHAIRHVRTSQAAVAWVVGLIAIPFLALPLYWIFAQHRFNEYREVIRRVGKLHNENFQRIADELATERNARSTGQSSALEMLADVLDTPLCEGNRFELLIDGEKFFDQIVADMEAAQTYIYACFYTIRDDEIGNRVADTWLRQAARGVTVRVLYDEVGSITLSRTYLDRLREGGVEIHAFDTRQKWSNPFELNFRNHRKSVIVDGRVAIVGGQNVGNEYLGEAAGMQKWRDTAVRLTGSIAWKVQAVFARDFFWSTRQGLEEAVWSGDDESIVAAESALQKDAPGAVATAEGARAALCATGPADLRPRATMMYAAVAAAAQQRLWISTPYLVPDDGAMLALQMCRARGVDVRLMIPDKVDHWAVYLAGFHYEELFLSSGIPVYRYQDGFLHQKCILVDDSLAMIGSTNLDNRSLHLNFELMVATDHGPLVGRVAEMLERDFSTSEHSDVPPHKRRRWFARAGTGVARLFSPIL